MMGELIVDEGEGNETLTRSFYGERQPKIPLNKYLARLVSYIDSFKDEERMGLRGWGFLALLGGLILLDRFKLRNPGFRLDTMNAHRMIMTAVLIAFKVIDDECCSNDYFSGVGGVELKELNALEQNFILTIKFDLNIQREEFDGAWTLFCPGFHHDWPVLPPRE